MGAPLAAHASRLRQVGRTRRRPPPDRLGRRGQGGEFSGTAGLLWARWRSAGRAARRLGLQAFLDAALDPPDWVAQRGRAHARGRARSPAPAAPTLPARPPGDSPGSSMPRSRLMQASWRSWLQRPRAAFQRTTGHRPTEPGAFGRDVPGCNAPRGWGGRLRSPGTPGRPAPGLQQAPSRAARARPRPVRHPASCMGTRRRTGIRPRTRPPGHGREQCQHPPARVVRADALRTPVRRHARGQIDPGVSAVEQFHRPATTTVQAASWRRTPVVVRRRRAGPRARQAQQPPTWPSATPRGGPALAAVLQHLGGGGPGLPALDPGVDQAGAGTATIGPARVQLRTPARRRQPPPGRPTLQGPRRSGCAAPGMRGLLLQLAAQAAPSHRRGCRHRCSRTLHQLLQHAWPRPSASDRRSGAETPVPAPAPGARERCGA